MPLKEDSKAEGKNPFGKYGIEKVKCEEIIRNSGIPFTILRPTYIYGPKDYTQRMDRLFKKVYDEQIIRLPKSNPKVQFVHVQDAAVAFAACLGNKKAMGNTYNICSDEIVSYGELVKDIGREVGKQPNVKFSTTHDFPYEDWEFYCAVSKSRKDLKTDYRPLVSGLNEVWENLSPKRIRQPGKAP